MAAITGCTTKQALPNCGAKMLWIRTPSTADSNDSVDVSSATATGGDTLSAIYLVYCYDETTGDSVTCTFSTTTITIDASGGTTNHVYNLLVIGAA